MKGMKLQKEPQPKVAMTQSTGVDDGWGGSQRDSHGQQGRHFKTMSAMFVIPQDRVSAGSQHLGLSMSQGVIVLITNNPTPHSTSTFLSSFRKRAEEARALSGPLDNTMARLGQGRVEVGVRRLTCTRSGEALGTRALMIPYTLWWWVTTALVSPTPAICVYTVRALCDWTRTTK